MKNTVEAIDGEIEALYGYESLALPQNVRGPHDGVFCGFSGRVRTRTLILYINVHLHRARETETLARLGNHTRARRRVYMEYTVYAR